MMEVEYSGRADKDEGEDSEKRGAEWKPQVVTRAVVILLAMHVAGLVALITVPLRDAFYTYLWSVFYVHLANFGVTGGAHRLWSHRAFKAKTPLKVILAICFSMSGQHTIYQWVRNHRTHHKYSDTDADPHNAKKGFFFSHFGWMVTKTHPECIRKGSMIDLSDVLTDPIVVFQKRYVHQLNLWLCFIVPTIIPYYAWNETLYNATMLTLLRYVLGINAMLSINSFAHLYGTKPYNKCIYPVQNSTVAFFAMGEGWHNYHHAFPWDYSAAEFRNYAFNMTALYLDLFAKIGWAYDLKRPSQELVKRVAEQYGDGSHPEWGCHVQEVREEDDPNMKVD